MVDARAIFFCLKLSRTITTEQKTIATIKYKEREKSSNSGRAILPANSQAYWKTVTAIPRKRQNLDPGEYP
jgi:hypothetical protein